MVRLRGRTWPLFSLLLIVLDMLQELFRIPLPGFLQELLHKAYLPVYGYGLMLVLGFLLGAQLMKWLARRAGYDGETFVTAALIGLVSGILGARLSHVVENWSQFTRSDLSAWQNFRNMLDVSSGGLTFYGGFLLATPVLILYAIWKRIPLLRGMDIVAPSLMLGLALGRMGCFLNGCCYGERCDLPWGVEFPYGSNAYIEQVEKHELIPKDRRLLVAQGNYVRPLTKEEGRRAGLEASMRQEHALKVHPTQLYSVFNALLIMGVLLAFITLSPAPGRVFALMLILKGISRFTLEMLRVEPPVLGKLSFSMVISLGLMGAGVLLWLACGRSKQAGGRIAVAPAA